MVKATPPPQHVLENVSHSRSGSQLPETPSPQPPSTTAATAAASSPRQSEIIASDDSAEPCKRLVVRLVRTVSRELTKEAAEDKGPRDKDKDHDDGDDKDGVDDGDDSLQPSSLPKTKAQQKMFADLSQSASASAPASAIASAAKLTKPLMVRLKRLSQTKIERYTTSFPVSPFPSKASTSPSTPKSSSTPMPGSRKRGRPRKVPKTSNITESASPPKKAKVHIKVPLLQNSGKIRALKPAKPKTEEKPTTSKAAAAAAKQTSQDLINHFGSRFFNCMVKVKRFKMPDEKSKASVAQGALCKAKKTLKSPTKGRPRKSNLSVSFSESVEILGSNESSSHRRSTLGLSRKRQSLPKPTRLQRVDATGNVLEDIVLATPTGKASLRLDDNRKPELGNDDEDEEYIVPNELPRTQRESTPVPKKRKKMSVTTTISDSETEQEQQEQKEELKKGAGDAAWAHLQKTATEIETQEKLVEECNSVKDKSTVQGVTEKVVGAVEAIANEKEAEGEEKLVANYVEDLKGKETEAKEDLDAEKIKEKEENEKEKDSEARVITDGDENVGDTGKDAGEASFNDAEIVPEAELGAEVEVESEPEREREVRTENDEKADGTNKEDDLLDLVDETLLEELVLEESVREEQQKEDIGQILDLGASMDLGASLEVVDGKAAPPLTTEDEDDILEIQTSLEDVRQLQTPTSSPRRSDLPHQRSALRIDTGDSETDSETSFKSISAATDTSINQDLVVTPPRPSAAVPSPTLPDELISTHHCHIDTTSRGIASPIPESYFNIEPERPSDDDDLGPLVEPDFHLSTSRHAISRGTLDDIMTALDS